MDKLKRTIFRRRISYNGIFWMKRIVRRINSNGEQNSANMRKWERMGKSDVLFFSNLKYDWLMALNRRHIKPKYAVNYRTIQTNRILTNKRVKKGDCANFPKANSVLRVRNSICSVCGKHISPAPNNWPTSCNNIWKYSN